MAVIGVMAACNLLYVYFIRMDATPAIQRKRMFIAGIFGITVLSSLTHFTEFVFWALDRDFHLSRIAFLANAIKEFRFRTGCNLIC